LIKVEESISGITSESNKSNIYIGTDGGYIVVNNNQSIDTKAYIYSLSGNMIFSTTFKDHQNKIDIKSLPNGVYLVKIQVQGNSYHEKFIKN